MGKQSRIKWERQIERRLEQLRGMLHSGTTPVSAQHLPKFMLSDRGIGLTGLFLSLLSFGGQGLFPTLYVAWVACFAIGTGGLFYVLFKEGTCAQFLAKRRFGRAGLIVLIITIAATVGWDRAIQLAEPPDLDLIFVYPDNVSPLVINPTNKVIQQPKYHVAIWNLDHPNEKNPLPIPVKSGDFIRPHNAWGPNSMLTLPNVQPLVSKGDHLFGFAQALCPDCKRNHYYWVYIEHGKHGWYCELPAGQFIGINELFRQIRATTIKGDAWIDQLAPLACRTPVKPYQ